MLLRRNQVLPENKIAALRKSIQLWESGEYVRATTLYKRYGISDAEFAQAMIAASKNQPNSIVTTEKAAVLKVALKLWNNGKYQRVAELCKKTPSQLRTLRRHL